MDKDRMEAVRANFTQGSRGYDERIRKLIPRYDEMLDALLSALPADEGRGLRVLDIGCGTGAVSERILQRRPGADLTCLDMTESMLDLARQRLQGTGARFVLAEIQNYELDGPYDAMVSSLALHHVVSDEDKRDIYRRIFEALSPGGAFINADIVLGSTDAIQDMYMERWKEFMHRGLSEEEIDHKLLPRHRQEDVPVRLVDHLHWLQEAGFSTTDVIWKYYNFAVYGGWKRVEDRSP